MERTQTTFCRICEACCGLEAVVDGSRVVELRPDRAHVTTRGYACAKGVRYVDVHHSPDRLKYPLKKTSRGFVRVPWETALGEIGACVRQLRGAHGPQSIAAYIGNPVAFSTLHPIFAHAFLQAVGTRNVYSAGSQDCNNKFLVAERMYGSPLLQPVPDVDRTGCFICIGSNPAVSHGSFMHFPRPVARLRDVVHRGGRVWHVNPRRTETARLVGTHVPLRPDTDVFFLASFMHELIEQGGVDRAAVDRHTRGFDELERVVREWPCERTSEVTGVPAETTRAMVASYLRATRGPGAALYASTGLNLTRHGTLAFWLLNAVQAVSGNLDRRGGSVIPRGLVDVPRLTHLLNRFVRTRPSRVGGFDPIMGTYPAGVLPDEVATPGSGQVRALFVTAGNPVLSCPDEARMREALQSLSLLVCIDLFRNETAELADYVLPATSFLERADLPLAVHGFATEPYLQLADPVVAPDGEQREEWWIFAELCRASGLPLFGSRTLETAVRAGRLSARLPGLGPRLRVDGSRLLAALVAATGKSSVRRLRAHPHGERLGELSDGDFLGHRVLTTDGRVDLAPRDFVRLAGTLGRELEETGRTPGTLRLISKRQKLDHNSWLHNVPSLVKRRTNHLGMHPADAADRGLGDGDLAVVSSATSELEVAVRLEGDLCRGTVVLPHGWGHQSAPGLPTAQRAGGTNTNRLASSGPEALAPLTGMTHLSGVRVEVRRSNGRV